MSSPYQRTRAVVEAKELLRALEDPAASPGVPEAFRTRAATLLNYFPTLSDLQQVHEALPELFGPPPPFSRLRGGAQTDFVIAAADGLEDAGRREGD